MFTELLTLGIIALGLGKAKNHATGIGRIKRRIYVEIEAAQQKGVDLEQKFMELPNSQKISLEETGRSFGWKQSKRSAESGKTYAEAYFNSLKRAYNAISGISPIGATPYTSHSVRNGDGHVILTWRDYAPAEEHVQAEAPAVTKKAAKAYSEEEELIRRYGEEEYEGIKNKKYRLHEFFEHLCVLTNGLAEMARAAGRFFENGDFPDDNTLLRECYGLVDAELHTFGEWLDRGLAPIFGQHAYLFWKESSLNIPCEKRKDSDVLFLFCKDQVSNEAYNNFRERNVIPEYNIEEHEAELHERRKRLRKAGRTKNMYLEPAPNLQEEEPANTNYVPEVIKTKQQQILEMWPWLRTYDSDIENYEKQPDGSEKFMYPILDNFNYVIWKKIKNASGQTIAEGPVMAFIDSQKAEGDLNSLKVQGKGKNISFSLKSVADVKLDRIAGIGYIDLYEDWC